MLWLVASMLAISPFAHSRGIDLSDHTRASELVFLGTVIDIQYAQSDADSNRLPHTFVTYQVERVFHGSIDEVSAMLASGRPGPTVTLRFLGGVREQDGAVMRVSTNPRFDLSDRDILFVRANTIANCPLTEFSKGRIRVLEDKLYTEDAQEILAVAQERYSFGQKFSFDEVVSQNIAGQEFMSVGNEDPNGDGEQTTPGESSFRMSRAMTLQQFAEDFRQIEIPSAAELRPVVSADPRSPFSGPRFNAVPVRDQGSRTAPE